MSVGLRILFFCGDLLMLNLSIALSILIVHDLSFSYGSAGIYLTVFSNLAWFFLVMVSTPYNMTKSWTLSRIARNQITFIFMHLLVVASLAFFFKQKYSSAQIGVLYLFFITGFVLLRVATFYLRKIFTDEISIKYYVLVGQNDLSQDVRKFYMMNPEMGHRFQGYIGSPDGEFSTKDLEEFCSTNEVHEIYCCVPRMSDEQVRKLIAFGLNSLIKVRLITATAGHSISFDQFEKLPGLDRVTIPLDESLNQFVKRIFDLAFSFVFTVLVLSWFIPLIGILIKLDSPGPIFFTQLRSGKNNKPFTCFKFRTMKINSQSDSLQATKGDKRITKLGHFLRKTSIDELPQFLNVLIGTMSVVGPRPHMLRHTDEYSKLIEQFMGRHYVKPGITGLAQCLGYRGETKDIIDMQNRVAMDRFYIENWTFWFDLKIIFLTVIGLIRGSDKAF